MGDSIGYTIEEIAELEIELHEAEEAAMEAWTALRLTYDEFERMTDHLREVHLFLMDLKTNPFAYNRDQLRNLLDFQQRIYLQNENDGEIH